MTKPVLPFLETMATQVCNLSCLGCTNYSDARHQGYVTWGNMREQLVSWLDVIDIPDFGIMGGEPLINPEIRQWLAGTRELLPDSQIRFTTNGLLLHKHLDVVDLMHDLGNIVFKITVHQNNADIESTINGIFKRYNWESVTEFGISRWRTKNNLRFQINRPQQFIKTYRGTYPTMMPHASIPREAFDMCVQQTCPLLHKGKIYKCSTQGLLKETLDKFGNPNYNSWSPYLINGIEPTSSLESIKEFIDNFGKPHTMCSMCPSKHNKESVVEHYLTVQQK
jgi:hypothetical protein